jgi:undecaprenyl-diphosphatase
MIAATGYKLLKFYKQGGGFTGEEIKLLAVGNIMAFIIAMIAIRSFIGYLSKYGFKVFGYYRIILGIVIILLQLAGMKLSMI